VTQLYQAQYAAAATRRPQHFDHPRPVPRRETRRAQGVASARRRDARAQDRQHDRQGTRPRHPLKADAGFVPDRLDCTSRLLRVNNLNGRFVHDAAIDRVEPGGPILRINLAPAGFPAARKTPSGVVMQKKTRLSDRGDPKVFLDGRPPAIWVSAKVSFPSRFSVGGRKNGFSHGVGFDGTECVTEMRD